MGNLVIDDTGLEELIIENLGWLSSEIFMSIAAMSRLCFRFLMMQFYLDNLLNFVN